MPVVFAEEKELRRQKAIEDRRVGLRKEIERNLDVCVRYDELRLNKRAPKDKDKLTEIIGAIEKDIDLAYTAMDHDDLDAMIRLYNRLAVNH